MSSNSSRILRVISVDISISSRILRVMNTAFVAKRKAQNLTQMGMAMETGLSLKLISDFENNRLGTPNPSTRRKLAKGYGVPIEEIPGGASRSDSAVHDEEGHTIPANAG